MTKRTRSVWTAVALVTASSWLTGIAEAGRSHSSKGGSASRSCLTSSARTLLSRIEQKFGRMQLVSTCRPGARIAGTGRTSRHASGNAIDFHAGGRKGAVVQWLIANHRGGGTMTYARMSHIHVDVGRHFVSLAGRTLVASSRTRWQTTRMSLGGPSRLERPVPGAAQRTHGMDEPGG